MKKTIAALTTAAFFSPVMTAQAKMPEEAAKVAATEAIAAVAGAGNIRAERVQSAIMPGTTITSTTESKDINNIFTAFVADNGQSVTLGVTVKNKNAGTSQQQSSTAQIALLSSQNYSLGFDMFSRDTGPYVGEAQKSLNTLRTAFLRRIDDYNMANIEAAAHESMKANLPAGALSWTIYDETKPTTLFARSCNPDLSCTQLATALKVDPETRVMSAAVTASHTGPLLSPTMPRETNATTVTMADVRGPVGDTQTTTDRAIRHCADADIHEDLGNKAKATLNDFLLAKRGVLVRTETAPNPVQHVLTDNQRMAKRMAEYMLVIEAQADKSPAQYGPVNLRPDSNSHKAPNRAYRFE